MPRYGLTTVLLLVALRLTIGWHFFREGVDKVHKGFSSAGFFRNAKGPFAGLYHRRLPDEDGLLRLNRVADPAYGTDPKITIGEWHAYRQRIARHYGFDDKQQAAADKVLARYQGQCEAFFLDNQEAIEKYFRGLERRDRNREDPARAGVASLRGQSEKIVRDLKKDIGPLLAQVDKMWAGLEASLNELATKEQRHYGEYVLPRPGETSLSAKSIDRFIPKFDMTIGILLLIGLFVRPTAIVAALFLCQIMLSQWPWAHGAAPIHNQMVEAIALLVLAATGAGNFAGLDFYLRCLRFRCCPPKTA